LISFSPSLPLLSLFLFRSFFFPFSSSSLRFFFFFPLLTSSFFFFLFLLASFSLFSPTFSYIHFIILVIIFCPASGDCLTKICV
jgi:hypothetical protein